MALSNILQPNDYNLFCKSITTDLNVSPMVSTGQFLNRLTDFSVPDGVETPVLWDQAIPVLTGFPALPVSYNPANGRFTATQLCVVTIAVQGRFATAPLTKISEIAVRRNGLAWTESTTQVSNEAIQGNLKVLSTTWTATLIAGDYFQVNAYQNSGSPINLLGSQTAPTCFSSVNVTASYYV